MPALNLAGTAYVAAADPHRWTSLAVLLVLAGLGAGYGRGIHQIWLRRGVGAVVTVNRALCFAAGLLVVGLIESPSVHEATERSFAMHMAQHMAIIVVAPPLLAAGCPGLPLTVASPSRLRRVLGRARAGGAGRWLRHPIRRAAVSALLLTAGVLAWHLPRPYVLAGQHEIVHAAEHWCLLAPAWLLWSCIVGQGRHVLPGPGKAMLVVAAGMPSALLGIALALLPQPLYPPVALGTGDPLAAQQLGGVVMWAPMELAGLAAALAVVGRWLAGLQRRTPSHSDLVAPARTSDQREEACQ